MTKQTTIELPEHQASFAEERVAEGAYGSVSEVVQAGLRLLEEQEAKLAQLRAALLEGEQSTIVEGFDAEALLSKLHVGRASR
ncbi:type II toxin-antitoxin system ParD family antitoxin [Terricaulis silvestris]|uniref:Antitoxin ParD1 n=1 Tax=Terricaulis silvestris TaxID=2686094 RepID=A0A6I6MTW4_9CAUL|nr:type II toxin-antitoxin system ParD family antitoxin [Terricaulis silvestris]QGZ94603.1 Antitoxin ParD1 [Terricaulis silvestris]